MTKSLIQQLHLGDYWDAQIVPAAKDAWSKIVCEKIQQREQGRWRPSMSQRPKLRTYRRVKHNLVLENYLKSNDTAGRRALARIRSGTSELRIESGRHNGEEVKDRMCWFGCGQLEDETHFLLDCYMYSDFRQDVIVEVGADGFQQKGLNIMLCSDSEELIAPVITFIKRSLARRRRVLQLRS